MIIHSNGYFTKPADEQRRTKSPAGLDHRLRLSHDALGRAGLLQR